MEAQFASTVVLSKSELVKISFFCCQIYSLSSRNEAFTLLASFSFFFFLKLEYGGWGGRILMFSFLFFLFLVERKSKMKEDCQMGCSKTLVQRKDASGEEAFGLVQLFFHRKMAARRESFFFFLKDQGKQVCNMFTSLGPWTLHVERLINSHSLIKHGACPQEVCRFLPSFLWKLYFALGIDKIET